MDEIYTPTAIQGSISGNFHQIFRWKLSDAPSWVTKIQVLSLSLFLLSGIPLMILALWNGNSSGRFRIEFRETGIFFAAFASWPAMLILHELVHGLTMRVFGAQPRYGARLKQLLFYATAPGYGFRRNAYIIATLAPLVLLSIPTILGVLVLQGTTWAMLLALCAAFNIAGSAGDLAMTRMVLGYSEKVYIIDEQDGFRVLIRNGVDDETIHCSCGPRGQGLR